jgi:hypothetical protein
MALQLVLWTQMFLEVMKHHIVFLLFGSVWQADFSTNTA